MIQSCNPYITVLKDVAEYKATDMYSRNLLLAGSLLKQVHQSVHFLMSLCMRTPYHAVHSLYDMDGERETLKLQ